MFDKNRSILKVAIFSVPNCTDSSGRLAGDMNCLQVIASMHCAPEIKHSGQVNDRNDRQGLGVV